MTREPSTERCAECSGHLPKGHRLTCSTRSGEVWRVLRFEHADGRFCELATNQQAITDQVNLPPGFKFVCATPLVAAREARP